MDCEAWERGGGAGRGNLGLKEGGTQLGWAGQPPPPRSPPLGAPRMGRGAPHLATGGGISGASPQMLLAASLFPQQPYLASAGARPVTYVKGNLAPLPLPPPRPSSEDSPWTLFLYKINKDVCKRSASAPCPPPLRAACFAQQTLYLYNFFVAGLCK